MSQPDELERQLMMVFQAELEEHLGTLNKGLLALEQNDQPSSRATSLPGLFRAAHSLKGAARAVEIKSIETIAHRLEDALGMIQSRNLALAPEHFDALLATVDAIQNAMTAHLGGQASPSDVAAVCDRLDVIIHPGAPAPSSNAPANQPAPADGAHKPPPTTAPAPAATAGSARPISSDDTIRVATAKLDDLMDNLGELLVVRMRMEQLAGQAREMQQRAGRWQKTWRIARPHFNHLQQQAKHFGNADLNSVLDYLARNERELAALNANLNALIGRLTNDRSHLQLVTDDLQNGIRNARMLPVSTLFDYFPRMVRDLARERGKDISLQIEGIETEVDRQALELMKDPLTHLLRNAVDHGIEHPDQRAAAGKPRQGIIRLRAEQRGNNLLIEVADDGQGIDLNAVRRAAIKRGLIPAHEASGLGERQIVDLIFLSGLSTAGQITDLSGRGIGMDVVRQNLEQLRGLIHVNTNAGKGTTFSLILPLTLATSHVLLVRVSGETMAVPTMNVQRILRVPASRVGSVEGRPTLFAEGQPMPLISLARVLDLPEANKPLAPDAQLQVVVIGMVEKRVALRVDGFLATQEVVIKPLGRQLRRVRNIAGATILGDGQLVPILNVADVVKSVQVRSSAVSALPVQIQETRRKRILVVDDSITTRALEKNILENAGYDVTIAADGLEALALIRNGDAPGPELIVSDINMPNMNGFDMTQAIKNDARYSRLPVVLVTSLDSPQDRIRGLDAGADAYIVKGSFDQRELLETIERMIL